MTTNPATRLFLVVVGSGMDVREKFGKSEVERENIAMNFFEK